MKSHCRIFVILARDAEIGIILRRGPSKWVQIIRWDTGRDTFEDGAWFHGRIYEEACDVSPDGQLFVYFAAKHDRHGVDDEYGYAWTAVSRPPWLYALALWPSQFGTWPGGGRFSGNSELNLLSPYHLKPHSEHPPPRHLVIHQQDWSSFQYETKCDIEGADWSGRDQSHRIVYAREGKLFRRVNLKDQVLIDLDDRQPSHLPAPAWARQLPR